MQKSELVPREEISTSRVNGKSMRLDFAAGCAVAPPPPSLRGFAASRAERLCLSVTLPNFLEATPQKDGGVASSGINLAGKAEPFRTECGTAAANGPSAQAKDFLIAWPSNVVQFAHANVS